MRIHKPKEKKINFETLCDNMLHSISIMETMNYSAEKILEKLANTFNDKLINKTGDFEKYLSPKMMRTIDRFPKMSAIQTLNLVKKSIDYDRETSYFQKVKNGFTIVTYYFEGDKLDQYKTDYKGLMQKDK